MFLDQDKHSDMMFVTKFDYLETIQFQTTVAVLKHLSFDLFTN